MITQAPNSANERINVLDSFSEYRFKTWRTKKLKSKQPRNRLPILAYNRNLYERPRITFDSNEWDPSEKYTYVKTNLLPYYHLKSNPSKKVKSAKADFKVEEKTINIQDVPFNVLESIVKPKPAIIEKSDVNPVNLDIPAIILPSEEESIPAPVKIVQAGNSQLDNSETVETVVDFPEVKEGETEQDLDYLFDKEVLDLNDLLLLSTIKINFLVEHLIPEGTITILAGPSDTGKSTLALQIATSIIQGKNEVLGKKITAKHNKVIYISTEDGPIQLGHKLIKQLDPSSLNLLGLHLKRVETMERLESELQNAHVDLVIIDTLADFFKGDINSTTAIRQFFNDELKPKMKKYGFTCLILHHIGKNKPKAAHKDQLVGSQSIEALPRQVLFLLEGKRPQKVLKIVKGNYVSNEVKMESLILELDSERLLFSKVENKVSETNPDVTKNPYINLAEIGVPPVRLRRNAWSGAKKSRLLELDYEGYTLEEMAKILGCKSASTVRNQLIKLKGKDYGRKKD